VPPGRPMDPVRPKQAMLRPYKHSTEAANDAEEARHHYLVNQNWEVETLCVSASVS
jgi:hypothetical protein